MTEPLRSLPGAYFDDVYRASDDPWGFATSDYERDKYTHTLSSLPRPRYERAFEIGCSLGVLTERLAPRCGHLLAIDVSAAPLARARQRCASLPQVTLEQRRLPEEFPAEQGFDLIVLSEVGYYWDGPDLARVSARLARAAAPAAHLVLVHWTPPVHDYPLTGDQVHEHFLAQTTAEGPWRACRSERRATYRLDVLERR